MSYAFPTQPPPAPKPVAKKKTSWQRVLGTFVLVVLVWGGITAYNLSRNQNKVDTVDWQTQVSKSLSDQLGGKIVVTCPADQPIKKGYIFDCTANDGTQSKFVRITEDDDSGHFTYLLTNQAAR